MKYAKIIDGVFTLAPRKMQTEIDGELYNVYNPPEEMLIEDNWLPVIETEPGEPVEGYHYEDHYEEQENQIVQIWELVSNDEMEISGDEALSIILGEAV